MVISAFLIESLGSYTDSSCCDVNCAQNRNIWRPQKTEDTGKKNNELRKCNLIADNFMLHYCDIINNSVRFGSYISTGDQYYGMASFIFKVRSQ
jgi:hypothetical protein